MQANSPAWTSVSLFAKQSMQLVLHTTEGQGPVTGYGTSRAQDTIRLLGILSWGEDSG